MGGGEYSKGPYLSKRVYILTFVNQDNCLTHTFYKTRIVLSLRVHISKYDFFVAFQLWLQSTTIHIVMSWINWVWMFRVSWNYFCQSIERIESWIYVIGD